MRRSVCNLAVRSAERSLFNESRASFTTSFCASSSSSFSARALTSELSFKQTQGSAQKEGKVHETSAEFALQTRRLSFLSGIFAFLNNSIRGRASNSRRTDVQSGKLSKSHAHISKIKTTKLMVIYCSCFNVNFV